MVDGAVDPAPVIPTRPAVPLAVRVAMVMFYLMTWASFLFTLAGVVISTPPGESSAYLWPAGLYGVLLVQFPVRGALRRQGGGAGWLWGFSHSVLEQLLFVLIGFGLIAWMTALAPPFVWLYYTWGGVTFGVLNDRLRLA